MREGGKGHTSKVVERRIERDQIRTAFRKQIRSMITDGAS